MNKQTYTHTHTHAQPLYDFHHFSLFWNILLRHFLNFGGELPWDPSEEPSAPGGGCHHRGVVGPAAGRDTAKLWVSNGKINDFGD